MYKKFFKRPLDFILSLCGVIILSPVMIIVAILVRTKLGSPIIFCQERPGKDEKIFKMYKFRSMTDERDEKGNLLPDDIRLTKFGKMLRSTSLDELPELLNIIKGDMSIVGPRPQLVEDMYFMNEHQRIRHTVRQGLTGLAQTNGRNNICWEERFEYDIKYIENITFLGDIRILFDTFLKVIKRSNVNTDNMASSENLGDYLLREGKITKEDYERKIFMSKNIEKIGVN